MRVARAAPIVALLAGLLVGACGGDGPPEPTPGAVILDGRDDGFLLVLRVAADVVDGGDPIDIDASLTWQGPAPRATVWGSGSGVVSFVLAQLDGDLSVGGAMTADCASHEFERLVPVEIPFTKSGGFSADDPHADFYRAFYADPVLRLPAGRWRLTATTVGYLQPCEMNAPTLDISLQSEILVR
ncbi:MAG TPA: hypothetical protein VK871_10270 [Candidatus Limnocylindrales bacterium]|nr:hypothetical protein [Candidatus Limnocylindrales bacterium]